jgi:hypothetical protein
MHCSRIRFGFESRQSRSGSRLPHGENINLISPFVALFPAAFGRLDPLDPGLMYLWVLLSTFRAVWATRYGKEGEQRFYAIALLWDKGHREKLRRS